MAKEDTLIYRAQTGDEGAFADLMRAYHAFVCAIVIGIVDQFLTTLKRWCKTPSSVPIEA